MAKRRKPQQRTLAILSSTGTITPLPPVVDLPPAEVWAAIDQLLTFVNHSQPITSDSPPVAQAMEHFLTFLCRGARFTSLTFHQLSRPAIIAMSALASTRRLSVRRCKWCGLWFLTRNKGRTICYKAACQKTWARQRATESRQRERARQERARSRVTRKRDRVAK
jgi:hypothetical protein